MRISVIRARIVDLDNPSAEPEDGYGLVLRKDYGPGEIWNEDLSVTRLTRDQVIGPAPADLVRFLIQEGQGFSDTVEFAAQQAEVQHKAFRNAVPDGAAKAALGRLLEGISSGTVPFDRSAFVPRSYDPTGRAIPAEEMFGIWRPVLPPAWHDLDAARAAALALVRAAAPEPPAPDEGGLFDAVAEMLAAGDDAWEEDLR